MPARERTSAGLRACVRGRSPLRRPALLLLDARPLRRRPFSPASPAGPDPTGLGAGALTDRLKAHAPWAVAAALAIAWLVLGPPTPDLAAQVFRTELFEREGFALVNTHWYGGHHTPGYSVLFPPLAALLGPRVLGALAAVVSAVLFERLARRHFGARAWPGAVWFGAATATDLFIGRLTFALGVSFALATLLAAQRGRRTPATALAVATTLASPVAGLFLAMGGVADAIAHRRRIGLVLAAAAFVPAAALAILFPDGGSQPWGAVSFLVVLAIAAAAYRLLPPGERTLRAAAVLYAASAVAAFALATPMGSNATRLAALFAGPVVACALAGRRRPALAVAALLPVLVWQWWAPVRETAKAIGDPSADASFHAPLLGFLERRADPPARVEIPMTRMHWEAVHVARRFPLARGWMTQLDVKHHRLLRDGRPLTAGAYHRWLLDNGVRYVALPDVPLDGAGRAEARLLRRRPAFLPEVWSGGGWRVFAVRGATGLAGPSATVVRLGGGSFTVAARRPGRVLVRVRWSPWWTVVAGRACVSPAPGGWTWLHAPAAGSVRVAARWRPASVLRGGPRCGTDL